MTRLLISAFLTLTACQSDETVAGYGAADKTWQLVELDGAQFEASATLQFPEPGRIAGKAPCNNYSAEMTTPYPWFATGPILSTKRACPDLAAETVFFDILGKMTLSEVLRDTLILSTDDNLRMVFKATE